METTKYTLTIPATSSHVALFLLPDTAFDVNYKALVYFQLDGEFKLFGSIDSSKPSTIFKLKNTAANAVDLDDSMVDDGDIVDTEGIVVGISIETAADADVLLQSIQRSLPKQQLTLTLPATASDTQDLANRIVKNAYNYLASFIDAQGNVNIKYFDRWWDKFKMKLNNDPKFLESD